MLLLGIAKDSEELGIVVIEMRSINLKKVDCVQDEDDSKSRSRPARSFLEKWSYLELLGGEPGALDKVRPIENQPKCRSAPHPG